MAVPMATMLVPIAIAFTIPGYSSISLHISETAVLDHPIAPVQRAAAIITGISIFMFGLGLLRLPRADEIHCTDCGDHRRQFRVERRVRDGKPAPRPVRIGGFSLMLVAAFFAAELAQHANNRALVSLSLLVAFVSVSYIWSMSVGLDSVEYHGLIQRAFTVMYFGWYLVASYWLLHGPGASRADRSSPRPGRNNSFIRRSRS